MEWSYSGSNGPENWAKLYLAACGVRQSPIDIDTSTLQINHPNCNQIIKWKYCSNELATLKNTGHGWQIDAENSMSEICGGPLLCDYQLSQIHCHWGEDDSDGSEHTLNGKHFSAELHLVHWNKRNYCSIEEAAKHPDGLCVFAVFLKLGNTHGELQKVVEKIPEIIHKGNMARMSSPVIASELLPKNHAYYSYMGSLTTPPCLECVIWIVFNNPMEISHDQLEAFRSLRSDYPDEYSGGVCDARVLDNHRPVAPRGERVVFSSDS